MPSAPSKEPDVALLRLAVEGDQIAFGQLIDRYAGFVRAVAYQVCGTSSQCEDIAQNTFVAVWRNLGQLRDYSKFRPWLRRIVRNQTLRAIDQQHPHEVSVGFDNQSLEECASSSHPPDEALALREEERLILSQIIKLPPIYREVILLYHCDSKSTLSISRQLEIRESTVRKRLSRGRELLRDRIRRVFNELTGESQKGFDRFPSSMFAAFPLALANSESMRGSLSLSQFTTSIVMTKLQSAIIGAALLAVITAPFAYHQKKKMDDLKTRLAVLESSSTFDRESAYQPSLLPDRTTNSHQADLQKPVKPIEVIRSGNMDQLPEDILEKIRKSREDSRRSITAAKLAALQEALHLSDEQAEAIEAILAHATNADTHAPPFLVSHRSPLTTKAKEQISAILEEAQKADFDTFIEKEIIDQAESAANQEFARLQSKLSLSDDQKDQVFEALSEIALAEAADPANESSDLGSMLSHAKERRHRRVEALEPILSPEQMDVYETTETNTITGSDRVGGTIQIEELSVESD
ncbi:MAG: sigma-70 family RNA polymerase sigma factor [Verrucomicrobiae bacterium]|nr:sigma-70 family RNA polymerase sigma factor [Verrucomicrobiae bacterium]